MAKSGHAVVIQYDVLTLENVKVIATEKHRL